MYFLISLQLYLMLFFLLLFSPSLAHLPIPTHQPDLPCYRYTATKLTYNCLFFLTGHHDRLEVKLCLPSSKNMSSQTPTIGYVSLRLTRERKITPPTKESMAKFAPSSLDHGSNSRACDVLAVPVMLNNHTGFLYLIMASYIFYSVQFNLFV